MRKADSEKVGLRDECLVVILVVKCVLSTLTTTVWKGGSWEGQDGKMCVGGYGVGDWVE